MAVPARVADRRPHVAAVAIHVDRDGPEAVDLNILGRYASYRLVPFGSLSPPELPLTHLPLRRVAGAVALSSLLAPLVAPATASAADAGITSARSPAGERPPEGIGLGLRSGYGIPVGAAIVGKNDQASPLHDTVYGQIPLWLDVGYRGVDGHLFVGAYGQYAFALVPTNVCNGLDCSASDIRFGLDAHWHFMPERKIDPWVGVGVGYEILSLRASQTVQNVTGTANTTLRGFELASLHAGADFKPMPAFGLGPVVTASFAQYNVYDFSVDAAGKSQSQSSSDFSKGFHGWITLGLRGEFDVAVGAQPEPPRPFRASPPPRPREDDPPMPPPEPETPRPPAPPPSVPPPASIPPPPSPPGVWPASLGVADRTQCTLQCMAGAQSVDAYDLERAITKQLGAIRMCGIQTAETRPVTTYATFGPDGSLQFTIDNSGMRRAMLDCVSRIPAPAPFKGPPNQRWKCSDYCQ